MTQRVDTIETVVDVFNIAMDIQELYLKQGPFKQLSMSEMHVLEAVDKESSPSMSAVANHLNVTLGTLTTAVKKIVEKGFLILSLIHILLNVMIMRQHSINLQLVMEMNHLKPVRKDN